jgi:hypothetical protein
LSSKDRTGKFAILHKILTMKRIGYLFLFLIIAAAGKAQLTVNVSDTVACADTDIMMTASGMETYSWSSTMALDTNAGSSVNATPIAGTYGLTITGFSTTLNDTDTVIVSILIHPNPTAVVQSTATDDNDFVCFGSSATLTAISDTALLDSVSWSPSSYLNSTSGISVLATPDSQTTYTALVTNDFGCTASGAKVVKVGYEDPIFSLGVSPSVICPGDTATFNALPTGIVSRFDWFPSAALSSSSGQIIQAWPTLTTTYTMTAVRFGCEADTTFTLDVFTPPTMSIMQSSVAPIKLDEAVTITVTCPECIEYFWKLPSSSLTTIQNVQSISPNTPGVKTIKVIGSDSNTCKSSVSTTITVEDEFIGTPFSITELEKDELKITQQSGQILVESGSAMRSISLYSILGENVASYNGEGKVVREIPTNELASGIYIMNVSAEGAEISKKVYVQ